MVESNQEKLSELQPFFGITHETIESANLNVYGICWDRSSTFRRGASEAPPKIRAATTGKLYNSFTETMKNLTDLWTIYDAGDFGKEAQKLNFVDNELQNCFKSIPDDDRNHLFLGGDHIITYLATKALITDNNDRWGMLYLDSHPDLYPDYEGDHYSHACVVRRIIEEGIIPASNILEVGIGAATPEQATYANKNNLKVIPTSAIFKKGAQSVAKDILNFFSNNVDQIYLSVDLDVLDPAFAPGVGNPESGGLSPRIIVDILHELSTLKINAFDIVELCPPYDVSNITAFAASKIIRETLGILNTF